MSDNNFEPGANTSNLPANKKAKAVQKKRAAENTIEAKQQKRSAAIYLRVSSEMQVDGFSIEAQKIACLKYAKEQGYEVTEEHQYIDEAYSAKNEERPAFKRMIMAAHSAEFSMIIIHKMDRFERNFKAMRNTLEDLANIGVHVFSISENMELANTLTVNLFGIINEHYLQNLSWETAKGKHQAAKEGYFIGSRVPFGYRKWKLGDPPEMDKRIILRDEKEAPALKHCFEMYASGNNSFDDLADYLNEQGFVSRTGRPFRRDTLRTMLENPIYIGIIEYQGTNKDNYFTYQGKHVPLISVELFNQVAEIRAERENGKSHPVNNSDVKDHYLVQNLLCCESCRRKLRVFTSVSQHQIHHRYYKDYSEYRGLECKHSGEKISASYVEGLVLSFLSSIILPRNWVERIIETGSETDMYSEINEQINKIKNRMERRCEAYSVTGIYQNFEKYEQEQKTDQNLLDDLMQKLPKDSALINTHITMTSSLIDLFPRATEAERYDIVHYLFTKIYVDLTTHRLTAFEPKPEFDFLFSTFVEENGWIKDENRYLLLSQASETYDDFLQNKNDETKKKRKGNVDLHYEEAVRRGLYIGPRAPLGYKKVHYSEGPIPESFNLIIDPPAAEAVRQCFEMYASGNSSYSDLAEMLNNKGFRTTLGNPFSPQSIYFLLSNRIYIGQVVYKGTEIYPGKHEAIISQDLWDRVQAVRLSHK